MKSAKEKAKELVEKFATFFGKHDRQITDEPQPTIAIKHAKQCALICVEEIINDLKLSFDVCKEAQLHPHAEGLIAGSIVFWNDVIEEINNYETI